MVPSASDPEVSLAQVLGARARNASPSRLSLDIFGGVAIAGTAVWARPWGWSVLASAAACFAAYGVWALAERELRDEMAQGPVIEERALHAVRAAAAIVGCGAFAALLFSLLGIALGTIIS